MAKDYEIKNPLVVMFEGDGKLHCNICIPPGYDYRAYGLAICDLVRHVAAAFRVDEDDVWEWVDRERHNPTTKISEAS